MPKRKRENDSMDTGNGNGGTKRRKGLNGNSFGSNPGDTNTLQKRNNYVNPYSGYTRVEGLFGNTEKKWIDNEFIMENIPRVWTTGPLTTWFVGSLVEIDQGTGPMQRVGMKSLVTNINLRAAVHFAPTVNTNAVLVRIMLIMDTQTNGAPATGPQLFSQPGKTQSHNNLQYSSRFKTLKDWYIKAPLSVLNHANPPDANLFPFVLLNWNKKVDIPMIYSSTTGEVSEMRTNNVFLCMAASQEGCQFDGVIRIRFKDQ